MIVLVAGFPGKTSGECVGATIMALAGVALGSVSKFICFGPLSEHGGQLFFVILAKLHSSGVAQGFVLAIFLYILAVSVSRWRKLR